jgi:hypothetical protein
VTKHRALLSRESPPDRPKRRRRARSRFRGGSATSARRAAALDRARCASASAVDARRPSGRTAADGPDHAVRAQRVTPEVESAQLLRRRAARSAAGVRRAGAPARLTGAALASAPRCRPDAPLISFDSSSSTSNAAPRRPSRPAAARAAGRGLPAPRRLSLYRREHSSLAAQAMVAEVGGYLVL